MCCLVLVFLYNNSFFHHTSSITPEHCTQAGAGVTWLLTSVKECKLHGIPDKLHGIRKQFELFAFHRPNCMISRVVSIKAFMVAEHLSHVANTLKMGMPTSICTLCLGQVASSMWKSLIMNKSSEKEMKTITILLINIYRE
jgi:hypothetical protein